MSKGCSFFNTPDFFSLLLADLHSSLHFTYSQPLYFAYLIFFFPLLIQLLLFLCPLLLSTSLLLVTLLAISGNPHRETLNWRYGLFSFTCKTVLDVLETQVDDEVLFHLLEPLVSMASKMEEWVEFEELSHQGREDLIDMTKGERQFVGLNDSKEVTSTNKSFGRKFEEKYKDEESSNKNAAGEDLSAYANLEVMCWAIKNSLPQTETLSDGEEFFDFERSNQTEDTPKDSKNCVVKGLDLKGYGSKKREKEWKRTLAGQLYEERMSARATEGRATEEMDLLWEVYEADSGVRKEKNDTEKVKNGKFDHLYEEEIAAQLCCLEAIRFSTMKVYLGVENYNLRKISKAFKGMGLFAKRKGKISS